MNQTDKNARAAWASLTHDSLAQIRAEKKALSLPQFLWLNAGLLLGNVLVLFNTGAFASITLHATGGLGISPSHGAWMQAYYFVSLALALPLSNWLAARHGEVRLYAYAMLAMAAASLLCAMVDGLGGFLLGRVAQGFCGGLALPVSQTLLMREYSSQRKHFAVAVWSIAALSPFTLGPMAGGWIADHWGWRWLFYLNVPLPLLSAGIAWALLFDRNSERRHWPFDTVGFLLLALALACLQTVLNRGQDADWHNSVELVWTAAVGLLALAYAVVWELGERHPLVDLRLFARRNFLVGTVGLGVGFMLAYGLLSVLLGRLQAVAGYTSFLAGSVLLPLALLAKPMAAYFHRVARYFDPRGLASLNMLAFAAYCFQTSAYDFYGRASLFTGFPWSQVFEGFCLGGLFVPMTTLFLSGLTPRRQAQAVELGGMLRLLGGAVGSPLLGVVWDRRAAFHQAHLGGNLPTYDVWDQMAAAGLEGPAAWAALAGNADRHAAILGLDDTFRLAAWIFIGLAAFVWLARPTRPDALREPDPRRTALEDLVEEP